MADAKVKVVYDTVLDLLSQNNGDYLGMDEFNRFAFQSSNELYDDLTGSKTNPRVVYGRNRIVDRRLNGFRDSVDLTVDINGMVTLPEDLGFVRTVLHNGDAVRPIDEDRIGKLNKDTLASPNEDDKYYSEMGDVIRILNTDIKEVTLMYLKKPTQPKYAYTMQTVGGRQRPVYDSDNSVDFIGWDERETTELVTRILAKAGVTMRDGFITNTTIQNKSEE